MNRVFLKYIQNHIFYDLVISHLLPKLNKKSNLEMSNEKSLELFHPQKVYALIIMMPL